MKHAAGIGLGIVLTLTVARAHDPITTRVTWVGDISRILQSRCVRCHNPDGFAPMSLATYEEARPWARAIKEETMTRRMPKWHAARGYGDFRNDPSLAPYEIALIAAWADGGAPRGTKADERPAANAGTAGAGSRLPGARVELQGIRTETFACGERALPEARLLAVQPDTSADGSVGMAVRFPGGRREIVGWITRFDPDSGVTYWLRSPLDLPAGSVLVTEPASGCSVTVFLTARR
jgi:hypothetical protein